MVNESVSHPPTGWPHDHGMTNVGAMVKKSEEDQESIINVMNKV